MSKFGRFVHNLFGCSRREERALGLMAELDQKHEEVMSELDKNLKESRRAAARSKQAARSLLKRLAEDIPE